MRLAATFILAVALLLPRAAPALGTLEGFYGLSRPPSASFRSSVSGADDPHLFKSSAQLAGGDLLLDFGGPLEIGAIIDTSWRHHAGSQTAIGGLVGLRLDLGALRLDALGEAGGHRYGNFTDDPEIITASKSSEWLAYVGLRPGVAFRLGPPGQPGLLLGVWGFARWDLTSKRLPVTVSSAGSAGSIKLGGSTIGATARVGFEF
jgi:hypothetical protein